MIAELASCAYPFFCVFLEKRINQLKLSCLVHYNLNLADKTVTARERTNTKFVPRPR